MKISYFEDNINGLFKELEYYKNKLSYTRCPFQIIKCQNHIIHDFEQINNLLNKGKKGKYYLRQNKEFTLNELSMFDGANGRPAYVAVNGRVYDVSTNAAWGGGSHFGLIAGRDLTEQFLSCHSSNQNVLEGLPVVGTLKK